MPEMLTPTSAIMGAGLGKVCNVIFWGSLIHQPFKLARIFHLDTRTTSCFNWNMT